MAMGRASTFGGGIRSKPGLVPITDPLSGQLEFLASEYYTVKRSGATLLCSTIAVDGDGNQIVKSGTVLSVLTGGADVGKYVPYVAAGANGAGAPVGFLFAGDINVRDMDWCLIGVMLSGSVIAARCTGLDQAAKDALANHFIFQ